MDEINTRDIEDQMPGSINDDSDNEIDKKETQNEENNLGKDDNIEGEKASNIIDENIKDEEKKEEENGEKENNKEEGDKEKEKEKKKEENEEKPESKEEEENNKKDDEKKEEGEEDNKDKEEETKDKEEEDKDKEEEEKNDNEEDKSKEEEEKNGNDKDSDKEEKDKDNEGKKEDDEEENDKKSDSDKEKQEEETEKEEIHQRSVYSLEGAKEPISIYTRRVMDISKIDNYLNRNSTRGRCGGRNLGNTCFMNSSIACLSNTTELTYYFLKGDYKKDINEDNSLGMYGQLAKAWGELLYEYWVENTSVGNPSDFKYTIGRKAERFRGYGQQDSHEFISVFLDYLNEDLNRTTKKQYIEMKEKQDDETDEECAKRYWECNLKRNDSIITDLFCGQYKSTITCPECNWINITFDPFDSITLPLLTQVKKRYSYYDNATIDEFKFFYITKYGLRNPYCAIVKTVEKNELLKSLIDRIKKEDKFLYHDKLENLLIVDMLRKEKYGYAKEDETLRKYDYSEEYLFSYNYDEEKDGKIKILMYLFERDNKESKSQYPRMLFVNKEDTLETLRKKIYCYLRKYILSPFLKENEEKDSLSLEIEKYIDDKENELDENKLIELIENEYEEIFKFNEEDFNEEEKKEKKEENKDEEKESEKKDSDEDEDKKDSDDDEDKNEEKEKEEDRDSGDIDREEALDKNSDDDDEEKKNEEKEEGEEKKDDEVKDDEEKKDNEEKNDEDKKDNEESKNEEEKKNNEEKKDNEEKENEEKKDDEEKKNEEIKDEEKKEEEKNDEEKKEEEKKDDEKKNDDEKKDENKETTKEIDEKTEKKNNLKKFIEDLPFEIYIQKERDYYDNTKTSFLDKSHFFKLPRSFKNMMNYESFKDTIDKTYKDLEDYEIKVVFNEDSKYINKNTFKLDHFEEYSLEYKIKEEEPKKKEDEEEDNGNMTLEKCLKKFCKEEQLEQGDEWYCSKCKKHVLAKKKMELYYVPKILIICFKRFIKDSSYGWDKNDDYVEFPINNLDLKDFVIGPDKDHSKYDLYGVSQHYGSTGGGHYTAVCKNNGQWFSYNDSSCHSTSESDALTSAAYVLFYRRQTD